MEIPFCDRCGLPKYLNLMGEWVCRRNHAKKLAPPVGKYSGFSKSWDGFQKVRKDLGDE